MKLIGGKAGCSLPERKMIKYLLPYNAVYYKANLHNHTVLSDGNKTPEEIKRDYTDHGYSIVAFTDHDKYYPHNDLTDEKFVALNGFELEYYEIPWKQKTAHFCFIAKDPDNEGLGYSEAEPPIFIRELPENGLNPDEGGMLYKVTCPGRKYSAEYINADIKKAEELGFFVTYNHPTWSLERYEDYMKYSGMDAMEIVNYTCITEGFEDDNGRVYEDYLVNGRKMYCIAADDNHNEHPDDDPYSDSYGGYIMLAAENLEYRAVTKALEDGMFYACGEVNSGQGECPQIKNLWFDSDKDGGTVHIETTGAAYITLIKDLRPFGVKIAGKGECLTEADFKLGSCSWFRLAVTGRNGCRAYTNAFCFDEI